MTSQHFECAPSCYASDKPLTLLSAEGTNLGDVYTINESVCTPIYDILRQSNLERAQFAQSQASFHSVCNRRLATRHQDGRPCILMDYYREPPTQRMGHKVCLVTTYSGQHISTLPRIFKEFSIPVSQHYAVKSESGEHVHSLPPWNRKDAWIIAWIFVTRRPLLGRVRTKYEAGRPQEDIVFGDAAMEYLNIACDRRREEWLKKCQNPKFAGPYAKEFFVSSLSQSSQCY